MNRFLYISFFLFSILSFGQQTYKVTEGELQYISQNEGIIIKKNDVLYQLSIRVMANKKEQKIQTKLFPISKGESREFGSKSPKPVFYSEIDADYKFDKLKKLAFMYSDKDSAKDVNFDSYKLCMVNDNFFAIFRDEHEGSYTYTKNEAVLPYIFLQFNDKKIMYTYDDQRLYLIPAKQKIEIIGWDYTEVSDAKVRKLNLTNAEVYQFSQNAYFDMERNFFKIDTLPDKKVRLKNIYNEAIISKAYDSIFLGPLVKCYENSSIDLYNLTFKKINGKSLKAVKDGGFSFGSIQVLEENKLKRIDWRGKETTEKRAYGSFDMDNYSQEFFYELNIRNNKDKFYLMAKNLGIAGREDGNTVSDTLPLIHTSNIKAFYFDNSSIKITSASKEFRADSKYPLKSKLLESVDFSYEIVIYLKDDKTYGMNYLGYFIDTHFNLGHTGSSPFAELQNVQRIKLQSPFYKVKKGNLYKLYPLQKDFRYKMLADFKDNFARFMLPDKRKGWIDLDGNEYFD
ncbi:MAG TPA: hypothetical protein VF676_02930 [Flavobacterium sp.]|jgi:hypothetical protein